MATNLLGRPVRLRQKPDGCSSAEGTIVLVSIDDDGVHLLVLVEKRLIPVADVDGVLVLD
jgi:hypothetical protein